MKEIKEMQDMLASFDTKSKQSSKELKAAFDKLAKRWGGADYDTPANINANVQQIAPTDGGSSQGLDNMNQNGTDSHQEFQEWARGCMAHMDNMQNSITSMASTMWDLHNDHNDKHYKDAQDLQNHKKNTPPMPRTPTQMEAYLKAAKMDSDFEVTRPIISNYASKVTFASKDRRGNEQVEFEIKIKK